MFNNIRVVLGDINGLKLINNKLGYEYGDKLLKKIANITKTISCEKDIVARWAEDEFIIIMPDTDCVQSNKTINSLKNKFRDEKIDVSLGIHTKGKNEQNIQDVIIKAENRMIINKLNTSKSSCSNIITSMHKLMTEKSYETEEHIQRLRKYVYKISNLLNLSDYDRNRLLLISQLHDIGKIAVPNAILDKPGSLTAKEWEVIRQHPEVGYRITSAFNELKPIAEDILAHHERWDGNGYPRGLEGNNIPFLAGIITIIDSYDVMTHKRAYKDPMSSKDAKKELRDCLGKQFDPK